MEARARKGSLKGLVCMVESCAEPMYSRKMCKRHYRQWHSSGKVTTGSKGLHGTPAERFWHFAEKGAEDACWPWAGNRDKDGYGSIRTPTTQIRAHRLSYEIHKGQIPDGHVIRHKCNNPPCVNPAHLLTGTNQDNVDDKMHAGRCPVNETHANTKFSNEIVEQVRAATGTRKEIARMFGMSESQAGNIRNFAQRPPVK